MLLSNICMHPIYQVNFIKMLTKNILKFGMAFMKEIQKRIFDSLAHSSSLPRESSRDFTIQEVERHMALRLDVVLEEGDLL